MQPVGCILFFVPLFRFLGVVPNMLHLLLAGPEHFLDALIARQIFIFDVIPLLRLRQAVPGTGKADDRQHGTDDVRRERDQIKPAEADKTEKDRVPRLDHHIEIFWETVHDILRCEKDLLL